MTDNKNKRMSRVREMKNNLILDAALEVFSEKGFHDTRLEDIAQEAGFSKASLYNYYKDKEMIFLNIALRERKKMLYRMDHDPIYKISEELSIWENYRRLFYLLFSTFGEHFSFILSLNTFQFFTVLHSVESEEERTEIEREYLEIEETFRQKNHALMLRAKKRGEIESTLSPESLFRFVDGTLFSTIKEWRRTKQMGDIDQTIDEIILFLQTGFGDASSK